MYFNPNRKSYTANPYGALAALRAETPVFLSLDVGAWIVTRYDTCADVLKDHEGFSASRDHAVGAMAAHMAADSSRLPIRIPPLAGLDAPEHTRLRRLVNRVFHPGSVAAMRPAVEEITETLLDRIEPGAPFDVVGALAEPLPAAALEPLIGLPPMEHPVALSALNVIETVRAAPGAPASAIRASEHAIAATNAILDRPELANSNPQSLVPILLASEREELIDREQVISMAAHIATVGLAPTTGLIANGLLALLENPDQYKALRDDPSLTASAVHELMRYDSPIHAVPRLATRDLTLLGRKIKHGDAVFVVAGAANRDPEVFPDPDTLDIRRDARMHLGFGMGPHICLGGPIARMVAEVSLMAITRRFPRLHLHAGGVERAPGFERRMLSKLVVDPE
jgi:cytochrome P450